MPYWQKGAQLLRAAADQDNYKTTMDKRTGSQSAKPPAKKARVMFEKEGESGLKMKKLFEDGRFLLT